MKAIYYNIFGLGHINPTLPLVTALKDRGVEIIYHSSPERKEVVESCGATFKNYGYDEYKASDFNPNTSFVLQTIPATVGLLPFLIEEIESIKPDFILYDSMAVWGYALGEICNIPSFCSVVTFALPQASKLATFHKHNVELDVVNRKAIEILKETYHLDISLSDTLGAYGKNNIVFTAKEFNPELMGNNENQFYFSGAITDRQDKVSEFPFSTLKERNKTIITMAVGTILLEEDPTVLSWYVALIEAFSSDDNFQLILAIGSEKNKTILGTLPSNVLAFPYLPQLEVLKYTDVFINHGGMNSINEALFHAIPMLVIPHSKDQFVNAQRLEELKLGMQLAKEDISPMRLKKDIITVLVNEDIKNNLENMKNKFQRHSGVDGIMEYIYGKLKKVN